MGQASLVLRHWRHEGSGGYTFFCPGCRESHAVATEGNGAWVFNNDFDHPTFKPSILVRSGHYVPGHAGRCWCTYNAEHPDNPSKFKCEQCHSYVTDGQIQFLSDCTHDLAGKTVPLPELPDHLID